MSELEPFSNLERVAVVGRPAPDADLDAQHHYYRRAIGLHGWFGAALVPVHPTASRLSHYAAAPVDAACREATLLLVLDPADPDLPAALELAIERAPALPVWVETGALSAPWPDRLQEHGVPVGTGGLFEAIAHARGRGPEPAYVAGVLAGEQTEALAAEDLEAWQALLTQATFGPTPMPPELLESWLAHCADLYGWLQLWDHRADRLGYSSLRSFERGGASWLGPTMRAHPDPSVAAVWRFKLTLGRGRPLDKPWFAYDVLPAREALTSTRAGDGWNHLRLLARVCGCAWRARRPRVAAAEAAEAVGLLEHSSLEHALPGLGLEHDLDAVREVVEATRVPASALPEDDPDHSSQWRRRAEGLIEAERAEAALILAVRLLEERAWVEAWQAVAPQRLLRAVLGPGSTPEERARSTAAVRLTGAAALGANATMEGLQLLESVWEEPAVPLVRRRRGEPDALDELVWQAHASTPADPAWMTALERQLAVLEADQEILGRMPLQRALERAQARLRANPPALRAAERLIGALVDAGDLELGAGRRACAEAVLEALEEVRVPGDAGAQVAATLLEVEGVTELYASDEAVQALLVQHGLL